MILTSRMGDLCNAFGIGLEYDGGLMLPGRTIASPAAYFRPGLFVLYSPEKDGLDIDVDEYPHEIYFFDSENAGISLIDGFAFGMKLEGTWRDIAEDSFIKYSEASEAYAYPIKQVSVSEQGMIFTLTFEMEPFETEGEDYYLTTVCVDLKEEK